MSAVLIDGKARAAALRAEVATGVAAFVATHGRAPGLTVVLVGDDPASAVYVGSKGKATREAGMISGEYRLPADTSEASFPRPKPSPRVVPRHRTSQLKAQK